MDTNAQTVTALPTHVDLRCFRGDVFRVAYSRTAIGWIKMARVYGDGTLGIAELVPPHYFCTATAIGNALADRKHHLTQRSMNELRAFLKQLG